MVRKKRIYLNEKNTKYCIVKMYGSAKEMQYAMKNEGSGTLQYKTCLGLHMAYSKMVFKKSWSLSPQTGTVYLCKQHSGAGIATHELMHATLWAHKHKKAKQQYPFVIKNMIEEETILRNFTHAVMQFYRWYWKIEKQLK